LLLPLGKNWGMKSSPRLLTVLVPFLFLGSTFAAKPPAEERRLPDMNLIPTRVLQRSISPKFYKSLLISPVQGWVVVRGNLIGTHLSGMKVVRSEPNDLNNHLALQRAKEVEIAGNFSLDHPNAGSPVLVHLLLYKTADGTLALSFAHLDGPGGDQEQYWGCARLAVLKRDGKWTEIMGPEGLQGKGWAVRSSGLRSNMEATLKMENLPGPK
jgi:hypothetical protein